jgi:hypothetical protein
LLHFRCTEGCTEGEPAGCPGQRAFGAGRRDGWGSEPANSGVELGHCSIGEIAGANPRSPIRAEETLSYFRRPLGDNDSYLAARSDPVRIVEEAIRPS